MRNCLQINWVVSTQTWRTCLTHFLCVLDSVLSFIVVDQLTQWKSIHHAIQRVYIAVTDTQPKKTNNHHHIEVPNGNNNRNNNNTQQKIYFLYFDVPFFCHFFSFNFHRVISGSFQFEFLAGNLHEYNDFWASTKRDNILKSRNTHNALTEKEREWIHQWIVRMFGVCADGSYHKPISLFHFFLSRKIWTHCQRNLFDWFRYLTTRFDCE